MAAATASGAVSLAAAGDDVPNRTPSFIIVSTIFPLITTAFFATRLVWRFKHKQRGCDDLMAALAYITLVVMTAFGYTLAHYGFGKHRVDILPTFTTAMFWFYMYQICYKIIGGLTKLCFCVLYLRLFDAKRTFCKIVMLNAEIIAAGTFAFTIGTIFQCAPIRRNWDRRVDGHCINFAAFWYSHAVFNTVMDIVVLALPIPQISTLKMKQRTKTGLIAVFALGTFTIAASIARLVLLKGSANSTDPTWGSTPALMWTEIEANTAVICCCLPALRVFVVQLWRRALGEAGPEISKNSDAQSGGRKFVPPPGIAAEPAKQSTMFSQVRYSPPPTTNSSLEQEDGDKPMHYSVLDRLSLGKKSGSSESDREGNGTPGLELGRMKTSRDFKHHSVLAHEDGEWELDIHEVLRLGPPASRGRQRQEVRSVGVLQD